MAEIKLLVIEHQEFCDVEHLIEINAETAEELLEQAKELKRKYKNYFLYCWHGADVYLYDPRPEPYTETGYKTSCHKPEELFEFGGYPMIIKIVQALQGVELRA